MQVNIKLEGLDKVLNKFGRLPEKFVGALNIGIRKAAFLLEADTKPVTPIITGRLMRSITTNFDNLWASTAPHTEYMDFVHRRKPFMEWGLKITEPKLQEIFQGEIDKVVRED